MPEQSEWCWDHGAIELRLDTDTQPPLQDCFLGEGQRKQANWQYSSWPLNQSLPASGAPGELKSSNPMLLHHFQWCKDVVLVT
jgi:hypothetical protein